VRVLSRFFRRVFLQYLEEAFDAGALQFFTSLEALGDRPAFVEHLTPVRQTEWVVYAKPPFAGPQQVLDYVGRYTHRGAISNSRVLDIEEGRVRFRYKDYRDTGHSQKTMTLPAGEFIRRFLLHVLPARFHRIRYYGLLGNRHRKEHLAHCRQILGTQVPQPSSSASSSRPDYRDRYEALTGTSLRTCPRCRDGQMRIVEHVARACCGAAIPDTS
jgi:hypothetical protein